MWVPVPFAYREGLALLILLAQGFSDCWSAHENGVRLIWFRGLIASSPAVLSWLPA